MKWYFAAPVSEDIAFIKKISAGGKTICLVKYANEYFALDAKCPHAGADLSAGWCENGKLVCPYHHYSYNLVSGRGNPGQNDYVEVYPVDVRSDGVYVGIKSFWDAFK